MSRMADRYRAAAGILAKARAAAERLPAGRDPVEALSGRYVPALAAVGIEDPDQVLADALAATAKNAA